MSINPYIPRRCGCLVVVLLLNTILAGCATHAVKSETYGWPEFESSMARDFASQCRADIDQARQLFASLERPAEPLPDAEFLDTLNDLEIATNRIVGRSSLYRNVHPEPEVRGAADHCQQELVGLESEIELSRPIYLQLSRVDSAPLTAIDRRYLEKKLETYRRSGVNQNESTRQRIRELNEEVNRLGQIFNRNIREDSQQLVAPIDDLAGLPEDFISARVNDAGQVVITTEYPDYFPVMRYAENDRLRHDLYKLFRQRAHPENDAVLHDLLTARYELAQLLGYRNYAHYITEDLMIETPEYAQAFIDRIMTISEDRARSDYQKLLDRLRAINPQAEQVGDWQKFFVEELISQEEYALDSREIRQYFHYDKIRQGLFDLTETLFGVSIVPWHTEVWHESVSAYEIREGDQLLGRFYLDMHPRSGKFSHAAAFTKQSGVLDRQPPIVALVCNMPTGYLEHSDVRTFFHEFGHLLHAIFGGHQPRVSISGIRTEKDFVEAPAQMLEEWIWDPETLSTFATNSQGEVIPPKLVDNMNAARDFGRGLAVQHQMFYAALSLNYYNRDPEGMDLLDMVRQLQAQYSPFPYLEDTYFYTAFGHLYGYSAIYYTYMWSLVIAADMFSEFEQHGMLNTQVTKRWRETVLDPGGSRDAADLVEDFLGRPYGFESFGRMLDSSN